MDYNAWQFYYMVASALVNVVVWIGVWVTSKDKARCEDTRALETRVTRLEENQVGHDGMGKVYDRINEISDQVSALKGEMKGSLGSIGGSVDMILDYLIKRGTGKQ